LKLTLVERRPQAAAPPLTAAQLAALVADLGCASWLVNVVLVTDREMGELRQRWYGGEGVTDVLSFSYLETAGLGPPQLAVACGGAACDLWILTEPEAEATLVGEVVLAPAYVARGARAAGWDLAAEWALLVVHGCLHILGWRHDHAAQRQAMRAREREILARAGFTHPLPPETTEA